MNTNFHKQKIYKNKLMFIVFGDIFCFFPIIETIWRQNIYRQLDSSISFEYNIAGLQ